MKFDITTNKNIKLGIFTDLHLGVQKDALTRLEQTNKCIDWIIKQFKKQGVEWIIFDGDFFDSRFSINVQTLNYAIDIINKLSQYFNKLFFIIGNHDTYYKNTNETNSISFFKEIGGIEDVIIIQEQPYFIQIQDKTIGLFPWGFDIDNYLNQNKDYEVVDYGFGHFEINGIEQAGSVSSGCKYHYNDLAKLANIVYSGHYHNSATYKDNTVIMLGSPLQLNWGEYNRSKYIYTLDVVNDQFISYQNKVNSRFEKIYYSSLENNKYTEKKLQKLVHHNFIKFVIDKTYKFEDVLKYTDILKKYKPLTLEIEYLISLTSDIISQSTEQLVKSNSKDNKEYLHQYIQQIYKPLKQADDSINLQMLEQLVDTYYKKSLLSESQRKNEN